MPPVANGAPIDFSMFGRAIAEFEFSLTFTDAPIDRFARGRTNAMTADQKRGALLFFGKANCVSCHAVSGQANEMFSDFKEHNEPVLARLDPALTGPIYLTSDEFDQLVAFLRDGLADPRVTKKNLCRLIPTTLPSGRAPLNFTGCSH
jgi:cytochrome c peroxidase